MKRSGFLIELPVPIVMLAFVGFYIADSRTLSWNALALPSFLIGAICVCLVAVAVQKYRTRIDVNETPLSIGNPKAWSLVALALAATMAWSLIGSLFALIIMGVAVQISLGTRRPLMILLLSVCISIPVYLLFKEILYVRLPSGMFGI